MIARARVEKQADDITALSKAAMYACQRLLDMDFTDAINAAGDIAGAFCEMAAALTASYYNDIRTASKPKRKYTATAMSGFDRQSALAAAQSIVDEFVAGENTEPWTQLMGDMVGRFIKDSADNCIVANAKRDPAKPRYAIVPLGDACAFCVMRASNGYTYPSRDEGVKSHSKCRCTATPVFGNDRVQGYDVDSYKSQWDEASNAYLDGDISDELKASIEHQRELKGDDFGYTNAVLMVMREQQGIS